jgi:peptide-methionine (R)-S-oxide reductase
MASRYVGVLSRAFDRPESNLTTGNIRGIFARVGTILSRLEGRVVSEGTSFFLVANEYHGAPRRLPKRVSTRKKVLLAAWAGALLTGLIGVSVAAFLPGWETNTPRKTAVISQPPSEESVQGDPKHEEYRKRLTDEQYRVTRQKGTERAFSGRYWNHKEKGIYQCVCCGNPLFDSRDKLDSESGWPNYKKPIDEKSIKTAIELRLTETRTEVLCSRCDAHLGHVFDDGTATIGLRYRIYSAALSFVPDRGGPEKNE